MKLNATLVGRALYWDSNSSKTQFNADVDGSGIVLVEFFVSLGMSILRFGSWTDDLGSVWPKRCGLEVEW